MSNSQLLQDREDNFQVSDQISVPKNENLKVLSMTTNGYQWNSIEVTKYEAIIIIEKLREMFNLKGENNDKK